MLAWQCTRCPIDENRSAVCKLLFCIFFCQLPNCQLDSLQTGDWQPTRYSQCRVAKGNFTPSLSQVGSSTGAPIYPIVFPAPASSNAACAFNALRFPNSFTSKLIVYRAGANFLGVTLKLLYMLYIAYNPFVLHCFQPKPCFPLALIRCLRIFLVNQSFTYPNTLLECPILKYCTQPRSIGLMSSFTLVSGWDS